MPKINRESHEDAKKIVNAFIEDESAKKALLIFLSNAIIYSNGLKNNNWNLNLDKDGGFVRLNVGHEYCVEIFKSFSVILVLRDALKEKLDGIELPIELEYWDNGKREVSRDLSVVPDCLVKVPDSLACRIMHQNVIDTLPYLEEANRRFISYAISNTVQLPSMSRAHSPGFISYLSSYCSKQVPNPEYVVSEKNYYLIQEAKEKDAKKLTISELKDKIRNNPKAPKRMDVATSKFERNPYIAEYVKRIANGICQDCLQPAPFVNKSTNEPFLEVHHIDPLSNGGMDTIENTIAICPNCHRKRHYG